MHILFAYLQVAQTYKSVMHSVKYSAIYARSTLFEAVSKRENEWKKSSRLSY